MSVRRAAAGSSGGAGSASGSVLREGVSPPPGMAWRLPLHTAAANGDVPRILQLMAAGEDMEGLTSDECPPLKIAAYEGQEAAVRVLLAKGAAVEARQPGTLYTSLHYATLEGHSGCVSALLEAGTDANACDARQLTPLHLAAATGKLACLDTLLAAGADIEARTDNGRTPLLLAAANGHLACLERLLARGADIEARGGEGAKLTPLLLAAWQGRTECLAALLAAGASVEASR